MEVALDEFRILSIQQDSIAPKPISTLPQNDLGHHRVLKFLLLEVVESVDVERQRMVHDLIGHVIRKAFHHQVVGHVVDFGELQQAGVIVCSAILAYRFLKRTTVDVSQHRVECLSTPIELEDASVCFFQGRSEASLKVRDLLQDVTVRQERYFVWSNEDLDNVCPRSASTRQI